MKTYNELLDEVKTKIFKLEEEKMRQENNIKLLTMKIDEYEEELQKVEQERDKLKQRLKELEDISADSLEMSTFVDMKKEIESLKNIVNDQAQLVSDYANQIYYMTKK